MQLEENNSRYNLHEKIRKRKKQRARKRFMLFKRLTIFLLLIITITLLALSPVFNIISIEVTGNEYYKSEELTGVVSLMKGNNAFKSLVYEFGDVNRLIRFRYAKSEDAIKSQYPYIKDVKVQYIIPGRVVIYTQEREPYAVVTGDNANYLIDNEGYVLETVTDISKSEYIIINGLNIQSSEPGQALTSDIDETMKLLKSFNDAVISTDANDDSKLQSVIEVINFSDVRNVKLYLDSRITVNIGDIRNMDDLIYRLNYLRQIYFKHIGNQSKGQIDFTIGEKPRFIPQLN